jgi:transposase
MDKNERKKRLTARRENKKTKLEKLLPMSRDLFENLFEFLDEKLGSSGCSEKLLLTVEFLRLNNIPHEPVLAWLEEQGGYCDCEVLFNVEEKFRGDAIL